MRNRWWIVGVVAALAGGGWAFFRMRGGDSNDVEYRYEPVERTELVNSISAVGQLVALTQVDIRSKAGGQVVDLKVEEGSEVKKGDVIAVIDPEDTQAIYDQAKADLDSATARAEQARINADLEENTRQTAVRDAEEALAIAKLRLERSQQTAKSQPTLTQADINSARAALETQQRALDQMKSVDIPRMRKEAQGSADQARAAMDAAQAELNRQKTLYEQDFAAQSAVERAQSSYEAARASHTNAQERLRTIEAEIASMIATQEARVRQSQAALRQSETNSYRDITTKKDLEEARRNVELAELDLQQARSQLRQIQVRRADVRSAGASTVRSRVSVNNALVQLNSTVVKAPRDGVITMKYLEEGTIIPPGTSTFSQGTAIVQLSDVTEMFVECAVDEADISQVKLGQNVRVTVESYPGRPLKGKVTRINPSATTEQNVTAIRVRVQVEQRPGQKLLPGLNATCEFMTLELKDVVVVPGQAIKREDGKTYVRVKGPDGKPKQVEVQLGEEGNDGFEVKSGLEPGTEVLVAEINLAEIRAIQERMQQAQQGGGLTGGAPRPGGMGGGGGGRTGGMGGGAGGARGGGGGGGGGGGR